MLNQCHTNGGKLVEFKENKKVIYIIKTLPLAIFNFARARYIDNKVNTILSFRAHRFNYSSKKNNPWKNNKSKNSKIRRGPKLDLPTLEIRVQQKRNRVKKEGKMGGKAKKIV